MGRCKVADFGLTAHETIAGRDCQKPPALPLRWVSPEALFSSAWSNKSDVWAYGMFVLECFSAGARPWIGMPNQMVYTALKEGHTPALPKIVPQQIAWLMFD